MGHFDEVQLEDYRLIEQIGAGGFGVVFRAYQASIGREVALKIIRPAVASRLAFIRRFEGEAQLIARLEHPFIVPLYDYWRDPEGAYLVMRMLRGGSLRDWLKKNRLTLTEAADVLDQVAAALSVAHRSRVVHRDMKPSNILLDEDHNAYLSDFGIARDLTLPADPLASPEEIVGSPDYLSPEQARGEPVTPQTDIYSLGVMLYEIVTGEHPFHELSSVERLYSHINQPLPAIAGVGRGAEDALNRVIQKATAKNPAHRYQDVLSLAREFREAAIDRELTGALIAEQLTPREMDILELLGEGLSNQEIAAELVISLSTVKWYNQQIYSKLDVSNRVQAAMRARQLELIVGQSGGSGAADETATSISYLAAPENPYKGLRAFLQADREDFYGREALVDHLLKMMAETKEPRFLAVVGPSGSGKTSLVRAGVLPAIQDGRLPGSETWFTVDMVPGNHPLDTLEVALIKVAASQAGNLHEQLRRDARGLVRATELILPDDSHLLLIIDQFEELFTLLDDEQERQHFLDLLATAATDERSRLYVVITLRADYYDRPLRYPEFGKLLRSRMETLLPLGPKDLERAISAPAERVHVTFEPGLVAQIVSEMSYQPGALPLLQVALRELFERRKGRVMTRQAYREIGGAVGALAKRAESAFQELDPHGRELARQLFLRLATPGVDLPDRRSPPAAGRRAERDELLSIAGNADLMDETIDLFAGYRLLALDRDPNSRQPTVELAHEALLGEWSRLRDWLDDARSEMRLRRQLSRMETEWRQAKRDDSFLLRGSRLDQFAGWATNTTLRLTAAEQDFLAASLAARQERRATEELRRKRELETAQQLAETERQRAEEQGQAAARLQRRALYLAGALVVAALLAVTALAFARSANQYAGRAEGSLAVAQTAEAQEAAQRIRAEEERERAEVQAVLAQSARATAEAEADVRATAEALARNERQTAEEQQAIAEEQRAIAEEQLRLTRSRQLALSALTVLEEDAELSILLALAALSETHTPEAEQMLHRAVLADRLVLRLDTKAGWVAYSPDGAHMATVGLHGNVTSTLAVLDAATGEEQVALSLPYLSPGFAFSPDGTALATAPAIASVTDTATLPPVQFWDISGGRELAGLDLAADQDHPPCDTTEFVGFLSFDISPDGASLATAHCLYGEEGIAIWDIESATQRQLLSAKFGPSFWGPVVRFSPDGEYLAASTRGVTVTVWDASSGEIRHVLENRGARQAVVTHLTFSGDSSMLATANMDGTARIWDVTTGEELLVIPTGGPEVWGVAFDPDGSRLATASPDGRTKLWDVETGSELLLLSGRGERVRSVAFHPDGHRLATTVASGSTLVWDLEPTTEFFIGHGKSAGVENVVYTPDGTRIVAGDAAGGITIWELATGRVITSWQAHDEGHWSYVSVSPDGAHIASGGKAGDGGQIKLWDASTGDLQWVAEEEEPVWKVDISPDGTRVAFGGFFMPYISVRDLATGGLVYTATGTLVVSFDPLGERLAVAADVEVSPELITVLDAASGDALLTITTDVAFQGPSNMVFSPDGRRLAASSFDGAVAIFDSFNGNQLLNIKAHDGTIWGIAYSPDGSQFVTTSVDGTIKFWDAESGALLLTLDQFDEAVVSVAFNEDGSRLVASSYDGTVRGFLLDLDELVALAVSRLTRTFTPEECRQYLRRDSCPDVTDISG
ncbi:MAG: protein kinase [Anaerolineae bacterium]|nr:protein kinase [Anaerolineae bacterium]